MAKKKLPNSFFLIKRPHQKTLILFKFPGKKSKLFTEWKMGKADMSVHFLPAVCLQSILGAMHWTILPISQS